MATLKSIVQEYLRSFPVSKVTEKINKKKKQDQKLQAIVNMSQGKVSLDHLELLNERERAEVVFKIFGKSDVLTTTLAKQKNPVLDEYSWQDFNLIAGNVKNPEKNALADIRRTHTTTGGCVMATQMVNPSTDIKYLKDKQATTKFLLDNEEVSNKINSHLKTVAKSEAIGLSLFKKDNHLTNRIYKKELNGFYYGKGHSSGANMSTGFLQIGKLWKDLCLHWGLFFSLLLFGFSVIVWEWWNMYIYLIMLTKGYYPIMLDEHVTDNHYPNFVQDFFALGHPWLLRFQYYFIHNDWLYPGVGFIRFSTSPVLTEQQIDLFKGVLEYKPLEKSLWDQLVKIYQDPKAHWVDKIFNYSWAVSFVLYGLLFWFFAIKKFNKHRRILNFLAEHLVSIQDLVLSVTKMSKIIEKHPLLEKHYGHHLKATRTLLAKKHKNKDVNRMMDYFQKVPLRNRWYFFHNTGRMLATYKLFQKYKYQLADLYYEMGLIDAQMSICKLMVESRKYNANNCFVFGQLENNANNHAVLEMKNMWNFGIDANKVVCNNITLDSTNRPRTIIITGPNAGGKSTYILGAGINAVLNQVYGIVAAQEAKQSIFYKIITYVNPTQNLAAGLSLAEAGMEVLKAHKSSLEETKQPVLAIVDEILNGTDPKVAADFSYQILKKRNQDYPNCVTLLTTHYMNLPKLTQESDFFTNKKVVVTMPGSQGRKFDYTFKIEDGVTDQNIVGEMLEEKGIL